MSTEKSAAELIHDIYDLLQVQNEKLELLNKQLAMINNKVTGVLAPPVVAAIAKPAPPAPEPAPLPPTPVSASFSAQPRKNIRVFGHLTDPQGKNLADGQVTITDPVGNTIKKTKTNKSGHFTAFLPPGTYSAEFFKPGLQPEFKIFTLVEGQSEVELV